MIKLRYTKSEIISISIVFLISVSIRTLINFSTEYIPGGNGAYYLVVVRNILENGSMWYSDFPLVFYLEAALANIFINVGLMNMNSAIDLSCRIFDSIVPVFAVIPAYLMVNKILNKEDKLFSKIVIASVSVLYVYFFTLVSDFQKNALGLLWLNWLLFFILKTLESNSVKNILFTLLFFFLTALTHYGCIAVAIVVVSISMIIPYLLKFSWRKIFISFVTVILLVGATLIFIDYLFPFRFTTLIKAPFKMFESPVLGFILKKQPVVTPVDIATIILINTVALFSLFKYLRNYKILANTERSFILTMIILSLFLSSPLLSLEYAQRLYFISYIFIVPLLAFSYRLMIEPIGKRLTTAIILIILIGSSLVSMGRPNYSNMSEELFKEMLKMKSYLPQDEKSVIVARHGLEFWSTWIFRNNAVRQKQLSADYWRWYEKIFFVVQKKKITPFGPAGLHGKPFAEPAIPPKSKLIYSSTYFDLFKNTETPSDFSIFSEKIK